MTPRPNWHACARSQQQDEFVFAACRIAFWLVVILSVGWVLRWIDG